VIYTWRSLDMSGASKSLVVQPARSPDRGQYTASPRSAKHLLGSTAGEVPEDFQASFIKCSSDPSDLAESSNQHQKSCNRTGFKRALFYTFLRVSTSAGDLHDDTGTQVPHSHPSQTILFFIMTNMFVAQKWNIGNRFKTMLFCVALQCYHD